MSAIRSASLLVVSPSKRVLFMLRPSKGSFANTHVFPGGALDSTDPSLQFCALRETYEETGLLINPQTKQNVVMADRSKPFQRALEENFSHSYNWEKETFPRVSEWTTPPSLNSKIFTTQFFLYESPNEPSFDSFTPNNEVKGVYWMTPEACLDKFKAGEIVLFPPQFYLMTLLKDLTPAELASRLQDRIIKPKPLGPKKDNKLTLDWGQGESGQLRFENGIIRDIKFIKQKL